MIFINNLRKEDAGRKVVYIDGTGEKTVGHITSWNNKFIFIDYGHSCGRGIATSPCDLKFEFTLEG